MSFDLSKAQTVGRKVRSSDQMSSIIEAALTHESLSGAQIAAGLNLPNGTYVPVGVIRQVIKTLVDFGDVHFAGKTYNFAPVQPRPELVKKPA